MDYIKDAKTDFILSNDIRIPIRVRGRKEIIERYHKYYSSERMNDHYKVQLLVNKTNVLFNMWKSLL